MRKASASVVSSTAGKRSVAKPSVAPRQSVPVTAEKDDYIVNLKVRL